MPTVVGDLCAGVLAGPSVLAHVAPGVSAWLPHDAGQFHLLDAVGQAGVPPVDPGEPRQPIRRSGREVTPVHILG